MMNQRLVYPLLKLTISQHINNYIIAHYNPTDLSMLTNLY